MGAFACLALCAWGAPGAAQERPERGVALNWVRLAGAQTCVHPVELAQRVERRLGRRVFVRTSDAIVVIEGRVGPLAGGGFEMVLEVSDPNGTAYGSRELQVPEEDCGKLSELAALIIAVTIRHDGASSGLDLPAEVAAQLAALFADDPSELDAADLPAGPTRAATDHQASAPEAPTSEPGGLPPTAASPPWHVRAEAAARLATGLQPRASFGPALRVSVARERWGSAELTGSFSFAQSEAAPAEARGELRYQPWQLGLGLCWEALRSQRVELQLCAEGALGSLSVESADFVLNGTSTRIYLELGAAVSGHVMLWGPAYVQLRLGVPLRPIRPAFQYRTSAGEPRSAFSVAAVGLGAEAGLGVEF